MKKTVRLTESDLHRVIKESVNKVLRKKHCINIRESYDIADDMDETGADGLWDYAGEIAKQIAFDRNEDGPIYADEWGQEIIYNAFKRILNK